MTYSRDKAAFSRLLKQLSNVIEPMTPEQLAAFTRELPKHARASMASATFYAEPAHSGPPGWNSASASKVLSELQTATSREDGASLLREMKFSRKQLLEVARARSVHVTKADSVARIEEKLVEAIIGSRLNSQAIRGG